MNELTRLDETRVKTTCKAGQGKATCSFLIVAGGAGMCCAKGSSVENVILSRRPTMQSQGDNCSGPPDFKPNAKPLATNLELWEQIAARTDLIGGDAESEEDGVFYRGPLKKTEIVEGTHVRFTTEWSATRPEGSNEWTAHDVGCFFTDIEGTRPTLNGDGSIHFTMMLLGPVTLFPKGVNNLDPATVKGLVLK